jgi:hypothetical protein
MPDLPDKTINLPDFLPPGGEISTMNPLLKY